MAREWHYSIVPALKRKRVAQSRSSFSLPRTATYRPQVAVLVLWDDAPIVVGCGGDDLMLLEPIDN